MHVTNKRWNEVACRYASRYMHACMYTCMHGRQAGRQADWHTDRQADKHRWWPRGRQKQIQQTFNQHSTLVSPPWNLHNLEELSYNRIWFLIFVYFMHYQTILYTDEILMLKYRTIVYSLELPVPYCFNAEFDFYNYYLKLFLLKMI